MAIPYKTLPFELSFYQMYPISFTTFYASEEEAAQEHDLIKIKENIPMTLTFNCQQSDARFYMDGLDTLPERLVNIDEQGIAYLSPCEHFELLKTDYYPFIPGRNLITVVVDNIFYTTFIEIIPTNLFVFQWESMVEDLDEILRGLSMDLIRKNLGLGSLFQDKIPTVLLYRFMVIQKAFPTVMAALSDLLSHVNHRIRKIYKMESLERVKVVDAVSVRHQATHPENQESLKVPKPRIDYDLPENHWIKFILRTLLNHICDFLEALEEFHETTEKEVESLRPYAVYQPNLQQTMKQKEKVLEQLSVYRDTALKMLKGLGVIKLAPWYNEVSSEIPKAFTPILFQDSRYFALYSLYKDLKDEEFEISIDPSFSYQHKRTDKLYELWGFLQICAALQGEKLGFEPVSGWIYDLDFDPKHLLIPSLPSGSALVFKKGDWLIRLTYDGPIPLDIEQTTKDSPIFMMDQHNTPDGRMDIYYQDVFIGSFIFDLKYRKLMNFYRQGSLKTVNRSPEVARLLAYKSQVRSRFLYNLKGHHAETIDPIHEVWAIYALNSLSEDPNLFYKSHGLRFLKFQPRDSLTYFEERLSEILDEMLNKYRYFAR